MTKAIKVSAYRNFDGLYYATVDKEELKSFVSSASFTPSFQSKKSAGVNSTLIIVLDRSGSMGEYVSRLMKQTFPILLKRLGYKHAHVFTFDSVTENFDLTVKQFETSKIKCRGCTYFYNCLSNVTAFVQKLSGNVRILTISDGFMHDIDYIVKKAGGLVEKVRDSTRLINSQAVRFITSSSQPDTRGLSSILQINTAAHVELVDWIATPTNCSELGESLAELFKKDGLDACAKLTSQHGDAAIFYRDPFGNAQESISLTDSSSSFWLKEIPSTAVGDAPQLVVISAEGVVIPVDIEEKEPLSIMNVDKYMQQTIEMYMQRVRVQQVLHSTESMAEVSRISSYFEHMLTALDAMSVKADENKKDIAPSTRARLQQLEASVLRRRKMLVNQLCELANDDRVHKLNALQQADYLRQTTVSKNSKGLARRGIENEDEEDLTGKVRGEVQAIARNIGELGSVDDSTHKTSFWSLESTVSSLRSLAEYVQEDEGNELLEVMNVPEILRCVSIVGVAARGQIGDYPDGMTWRADEVYSGCFASVADITDHALLSGGVETLSVPGSSNTKHITNVIPYFDDLRVHKFMKKYCPTILELIASIGMRRMVANVPMTHAYTILAGAWYCTDKLLHQQPSTSDTENVRSHVDIITCWKLFSNASIAFGKYFHRIYPYLTHGLMKDGVSLASYVQEDASDADTTTTTTAETETPVRKVHFICNNGLTNMLTSLARAASEQLVYDEASVLRAIFNYECYQFTKKILNQHAEDKANFIDETLKGLLQLDYDRDCPDVGHPFSQTPEFSFSFSNLSINQELAKKLTFAFKWVESAALIPSLLRAFSTAVAKFEVDVAAQRLPGTSSAASTIDNYVVDEVRKTVPMFAEEVFCNKLGLSGDGMNLTTYKVAQLLQGLVYHSKQLRSDDDGEVMRVEDLQTVADCLAFAKNLASKIYLKEYELRVKQKKTQETAKAVDFLVQSMLNAANVMSFVKLMQEGVTYKGVFVTLSNESSDGVKDLITGLADTSFNIPERLEKIGVFMMGKVKGTTTSGEEKEVIVWNNGNAFRGEVSQFAQVFKSNNKEKRWYSLMKKHKKACVHLYRDAVNRHGHGNGHPSYWALGFRSLDEMKDKVSSEEYAKYVANHVGCCGL